MKKPDQRILFSKNFSQFSKQQLVHDQRAQAVRKFVLNQDIRIQTEAETTQSPDSGYVSSPMVKIIRSAKRFDISPKQFPSLGHYSPKYDLVQKYWMHFQNRRQQSTNMGQLSFRTSKSVPQKYDFLDDKNYPKHKVKGSIELSKQTERLNISTNLEGPHPERFSPIKETLHSSKVKKIPSTSFYLNSPRSDYYPSIIERSYSPKYGQVRKCVRGTLRFETASGRSDEIIQSLTFNENRAHDYNCLEAQKCPISKRNYTYLFKHPKSTHQYLPSHMSKQNTSRLQLETFSEKMLEQNRNI